MKNRSSSGETLNGFKRQIRGGDSYNVPELVNAGLENPRFELTNILRWEDDGGQMVVYINLGDPLGPFSAFVDS